MKKTIALLMAVMMGAALLMSGCKKEPAPEKITLQVYTNSGFAPFEYLDDKGDVIGVDIDVMNYIAKELGWSVNVSDIEFDAIMNEIQKDKYAVGAAGITKKPDRDDVALASDVYANSVQYVIAPNGTFTDGAVVSYDEIKAYAESIGKGIGAQVGTTGLDMAAEILDGNDTIGEVDYANAIIASYDVGTSISSVIVDKLPAEAICANDSKLSCWQIDAESESYVLYFNKESADLVAEVNKILAKMAKDGTITEFIVKHSNNNN